MTYEQATESPFTLKKRWSVEEVTCFSPCLVFVLFFKSATYTPTLCRSTYLSLPAKDVFSCACITLQSPAWSLAGFSLFLLIHWEDEHQIFRIHFIYIFTSLNLKIIIQIFMKAGNTKHAHKLHSAHKNIVVLCYVLHLSGSSQSGELVFFLSFPTAQSNKPHATPHLLPATSLEIRNSRGWISPMSPSKWNQKGAALDNWSLLLQLQRQYFLQSWLSALSFLQPQLPSSPHMLHIFLSIPSLPFNTSSPPPDFPFRQSLLQNSTSK